MSCWQHRCFNLLSKYCFYVYVNEIHMYILFCNVLVDYTLWYNIWCYFDCWSHQFHTQSIVYCILSHLTRALVYSVSLAFFFMIFFTVLVFFCLLLNNIIRTFYIAHHKLIKYLCSFVAIHIYVHLFPYGSCATRTPSVFCWESNKTYIYNTNYVHEYNWITWITHWFKLNKFKFMHNEKGVTITHCTRSVPMVFRIRVTQFLGTFRWRWNFSIFFIIIYSKQIVYVYFIKLIGI